MSAETKTPETDEAALMAAEDKPATPPKSALSKPKAQAKAQEPTIDIKTAFDDDGSEPDVKTQKKAPKKTTPVVFPKKKRQQCTYMGAHGIQCPRFPHNGAANNGRCSIHAKSKPFQPCQVRDCTGWTRLDDCLCSPCKLRLQNASKREVRAKKIAEGVAYVNALNALTAEQREKILDSFGAGEPKPRGRPKATTEEDPDTSE